MCELHNREQIELEQIEALLEALVKRLSDAGHRTGTAVERAVVRSMVRSLVTEAEEVIHTRSPSMGDGATDRLLYQVQLRFPVLHHLMNLLPRTHQSDAAPAMMAASV